MSNYSRQNKHTNKDSQETDKAGGHLKKGLSAFQKTLTLIGSMLGIITATITIMNAMKSNEQKKSDTGSTQTTIIKEYQKEAPAENNPAQNQEANQESTTSVSPTENQNDSKVQTETSSNPNINTQTAQTEATNSADTAPTENKANP